MVIGEETSDSLKGLANYLLVPVLLFLFYPVLFLFHSGSRLLTGGESIQIWAFSQEHHEETGGGSKSVHFDVGGVDEDHKADKDEGDVHDPLEEISTIWICVWRCK